MATTRTRFGLAAALTVLAIAAGCTMSDQSLPSFVGPSELGLSLALAANPDTITRDGASQSLITVDARNDQSQPVSSLALKADLWCVDYTNQRQLADFGSLSGKNAVTGSNGRATLVYTAPAQQGPMDGVCQPGLVWITITPTGTNYANAQFRDLQIRLVEPGIIVPPLNLQPSFTFTPTSPVDNDDVLFDASTSTGTIASYSWTFGDGSTGTGAVVTHKFTKAGNYTVTLTIADSVGRAMSTSQQVAVAEGAAPTADFDFSPLAPVIDEPVFFNAAKSQPAPGRTIASYAWNFGDGTTGSGVTVQKSYSAPGTYTVTLTVTDDAGRKGTTSKTIVPAESAPPTADFEFSPLAPLINQTVFFNATKSQPAPGRTIASYAWNFGDGTTGSGVTVQKSYSAPGTYTVTLTVTDNVGRKGTTSKTVALTEGTPPTADFDFSPTSPATGQAIFFNASKSRAATGRRIVAYDWDFGSGRTGSGLIVQKTYDTPGTYVVTLVVTDDVGRKGATSKNVAVGTGGSGGVTASFFFSPTDPVVGEIVSFNASSSTSPAGIVKWEWDFGDTLDETRTVPTIQHTFGSAKTYVVRLTVTDAEGKTATTQQSVVVTAVPATQSVVVK